MVCAVLVTLPPCLAMAERLQLLRRMATERRLNDITLDTTVSSLSNSKATDLLEAGENLINEREGAFGRHFSGCFGNGSCGWEGCNQSDRSSSHGHPSRAW